jgi:PAS domain S-box-containing protein
LFQKTSDEILNQTFLSLALEEDRDQVRKYLNNLDEPPYTSYYEERALTKSGLRWLAWSSRAILDADGQPVEYVAVGRDITEKKQAEKTLRENQAWLQNILDSVQAGVIVIDPETHAIIELNRAAAEMIGTKKDHIVNNICHNYLCPNDIGMCPVTDLGQSVEQSDRELLTVNGTRIPVLKTVSCATINEKEYLIESFIDLREKKQLESMLLRSPKMESIGSLAGGIAHDFNNILFPIVGMAELLLEDLSSQSLEYENAQVILKAGNRGSDLVKQILTFSRQSEHKLIPIRVQQVLIEVMKLMRSTIPSYIEIEENIQSDCGLLLADSTQIHQVAMNIITNAYHAVESKRGKINAQLREVVLGVDEFSDGSIGGGRYALFSVTDTGHGISPELMDKIFEPYFTTKEQGKGTGLGLAVAYGIIKEHKGDIRVYSEVGKGTTFNIYLPLLEKIVGKDTDEQSRTDPKGNERILLVDDEESIAGLEKQMLERLGYKVTSRVNSVETLEVFKAMPDAYDLVITDMTMPNMTGDQLADKMNEIRPDLPVIICTGFSERINGERAKAIGVKGFLMKPVIKSELAKIVREVLDEAKG